MLKPKEFTLSLQEYLLHFFMDILNSGQKE